MREINLDDGMIKYDGEWLSAEDLTKKIKEKMDAGEMKFAALAAILEELNNAVEKAKTVDVKLVFAEEEYKKLKILGDNDRECIKKIVMEFIRNSDVESKPSISSEKAPPPLPEKSDSVEKTIIKCFKCKSPIEINADAKLSTIECPQCSATGRLKPEDGDEEIDVNSPRYQDHFLG